MKMIRNVAFAAAALAIAMGASAATSSAEAGWSLSFGGGNGVHLNIHRNNPCWQPTWNGGWVYTCPVYPYY